MVKQTRRALILEQNQERRKQLGRIPNEKFVHETENRLGQFKPTLAQQLAIEESQANTLTFIKGPAGSGKTSAVLYDYCKEYLRDSRKQIVVIRSAFEAGQLDKIGFLPNELEDKLQPHFESVKKILIDFLGKGKVESDIASGRIKFMIPNFALGMTITNGLVLLDEAQVIQPMILKLILERVGKGTRIVVAGDPSQLYADTQEGKLRNGLSDAIGRFVGQNGVPKYDDVGYFEYQIDDIQRSDIVKTVVRAYS